LHNNYFNSFNKDILPYQEDDCESLVFFYKMMADFIRYQCELSTDHLKMHSPLCAEYYLKAVELAKGLPTTDPLRLGLALNYSVYSYEIENNPEKACIIAKNDDAIADLDQLSEEDYKASTLIMQLMRDGLTLYTCKIPGDQDDQ
jgi:14-3-3 protein epsilon